MWSSALNASADAQLRTTLCGQTGLLVTYAINSGIAYLSYLEAKRVGQVRKQPSIPCRTSVAEGVIRRGQLSHFELSNA